MAIQAELINSEFRHDYFWVDLDIIWASLSKGLIALKRAIQKITL